MQSDIDYVNVVGSEPLAPQRSNSESQSLQIGAVSSSTTFHNPYAAPFVPGQNAPQSRKVHVNGHAPSASNQQQTPMSLHGSAASLTAPAASSFYQQDLNLMSSSVLNSGVSLGKGGNISSNSSLAGGPSRLLYDLDFQDSLLDSGGGDYFGDSISLNGDSRSATNNLLSSLRENSMELRDDSLLDEYPPAINLSSLGSLSNLSSGLNGASRPGGGFGANGRSNSNRYQGVDGFGGEFDFETSSNSSHDAYHQASSANTTAKSRGYTGPHLLGGEEYGVSPDPSPYIPNTYGGYHGAADYQQQHHQQQHQYASAPAGYGPGPRGMVRSNSRPLMLNQQQQMSQGQQQPKFQHKRYDPSQQYNNKK